MVLERLDAIEALQQRGAPPEEVLAEIRALVEATERWLEAEPAAAASAGDALERSRRALLAERELVP